MKKYKKLSSFETASIYSVESVNTDRPKGNRKYQALLVASSSAEIELGIALTYLMMKKDLKAKDNKQKNIWEENFMNELMEIGNVLYSGMMTAAEMTHALCELGNGSMADGIFTVFEGGIQLGILGGFPVGWENGWKAGYTKGILTGAAVVVGGAAVVGLCIWGKKKYEAIKMKKKEDSPLEVSNTITDGDIALQETACMHAV